MNIRKVLVVSVSVLALFVLGVVLFNSVVMPMLVHQRSAVIVPDLHSVIRAQAQRRLEGVGLNMRILREEHHAGIPAGYVVSQTPRPNETIKEARTVEVVISLGARTQRVPELRGMSLRQARGTLERFGLSVGRVARVIAEGDAGEAVKAMNPAAGEELVEGSSVDIVLSVGGQKNRFAMPDLAGQDLLFIREKLRDMGFRVSSVQYEKREGVFPNTIVGQSPAPGAMIREGDSIELVAASSD